MKGNITTQILLVSALASLATLASGQVLNAGGQAAGAAQAGATQAAGAAAGAAHAALPPPTPIATPPASLPPTPTVTAPSLPPPTISAGAAAGASSGAAGSVTSPINRPDVGASTTSNAGGNVGASVSTDRTNVNAGGTAAGNSRLTGIDNAVAVTGNTSASVQATETLRQIQATGHATRDQMATTVQARLDATQNVVDRLRSRADAAGDKSRAAFAKALTEVRQREQDVRADLRDAARATGETWGKAQSELAQSYGAYAKAVAEAEVAATAGK